MKRGPKPMLLPCPYCKDDMSTRALLLHLGKCLDNPRVRLKRKGGQSEKPGKVTPTTLKEGTTVCPV